VAGPFVHVVYAFPSDGSDRTAVVGPAIANDIAEIDAWWRGQDATRAPRFDVAPLDCGTQVDLTTLRLPQAGSQLAPIAGRANSIVGGLSAMGMGSPYGKYLVYYDGANNEPDICGQGGGPLSVGPSYAIVYVGVCDGVPTAPVAAHELLHAMGALPPGAPHACSAEDDGHPCDSEQDILFPYASGAALTQLLLDVGRDDYYGHAGGWDDLQDSPWLRKLDAQVTLSATVTGGGKVVSVQPGPECAATCSVEWDRGSDVTLEAIAPAGKRFVRWTGACRGELPCMLKLDAATTVSALFAQARFRLAVAVAGKGVVRSTPTGLACRVRCSASFTSFKAVRLRATANKGWRFARWTGGCTGTGACVVPMTKAAGVRAVFAHRR
jgi:Divergent InlB B-repeat domain